MKTSHTAALAVAALAVAGAVATVVPALAQDVPPSAAAAPSEPATATPLAPAQPPAATPADPVAVPVPPAAITTLPAPASSIPAAQPAPVVAPPSAQQPAAGDEEAADSDLAELLRQKIRRENLIANSPFRLAPRRLSASTQPLEIRGFAGFGDNLEISLTNPRTRECHWVRLRDRDAKWYVKSADPIARTAVVELNGTTIDVEMVKASETPMPIRPAGGAPVTPRAVPPVQAPVARPATQPAVVRPAAPNTARPANAGAGAAGRPAFTPASR